MSGWVDIVESFLGNGNTVRTEGAGLLVAAGELTGSMGDDIEYLFSNYLTNKNLEQLKPLLSNNSAIAYMDGLLANKPSVFIANAYGDSLFTPNQFPSFFNKLTGPKHMEFAPGYVRMSLLSCICSCTNLILCLPLLCCILFQSDHAGPELTGAF